MFLKRSSQNHPLPGLRRRAKLPKQEASVTPFGRREALARAIACNEENRGAETTAGLTSLEQ